MSPSAIPAGPRPSRADIFGTISVNYKLFLNILGRAIFAVSSGSPGPAA